jgi:P-type Ca2+ transporter type 2C
MSQGRASAPEAPWHTLSAEDAAKRLGTDFKRGLPAAEARQRLQKFGPNELEAAKARSALSIFFDQFKSLIVLLLAIATGVAFSLGDHLEAISIIVVILLNALIGFLTEAKAEKAMAALKKSAAPTAQVFRDGNETQIPSREVVPGDVIVLAAGARVPADGRIIESVRLQIQEAALTGESHAINKVPDVLPDAGLALGDRTNMAFMGTSVTDGRGRTLVTATGAQTEMGRIGKLIEEARSEETPLEKKLAQLGRALILIVLGLCLVIAIAGYLRGHGALEMFKVAISLAVAAVPEGLPAVATVTLALGVQRMAKHHALIRHLAAVETLGSTTVICVDKTGTLTKNEMTVAAYELEGRRIEVTGSGYSAEGEFRDGEKKIDLQAADSLSLALRIGALCNDAKVERKEKETAVLGDPTEAALIVAAEKAGFNPADLQREYPRLREIPFDSEAKRMVTIHRTPENKVEAYVKGSPAAVLERSSRQIKGHDIAALTPEDRERFLGKNRELAGAALRVLALAHRDLPGEQVDKAEFDRDLIFVGFVGMIDPLREEARDAIKECREAGMRVIMLTGDQPATAEELARQLGVNVDTGGKALKTVHARELDKVGAEGWSGVVENAGVFARVTPEHKLRIIEALQKDDQIVAMTGDGVNDAPALKKANIGIAMGIKGTEVAKETAAMIITDDNFASIVKAVEQGRIIYRNIQRVIHYLFSCNLSEILTVFVAILIGWPLPLAALQILWLNLITDVFPALALALEPAEPGVMKQPPRDPREKILHWRFNSLIAWQGLLLAAVTLTAFGLGLRWHGREDLRQASTMAFMTLALAQTVHAFNTRSQVESMFNRRLFSNPWLWSATLVCILLQIAAIYVPLLQKVLHTVVPSAADWVVIALCSIAPVLVVEITKRASIPRRRANPERAGQAGQSR